MYICAVLFPNVHERDVLEHWINIHTGQKSANAYRAFVGKAIEKEEKDVPAVKRNTDTVR